jgi:hypothetical protein
LAISGFTNHTTYFLFMNMQALREKTYEAPQCGLVAATQEGFHARGRGSQSALLSTVSVRSLVDLFFAPPQPRRGKLTHPGAGAPARRVPYGAWPARFGWTTYSCPKGIRKAQGQDCTKHGYPLFELHDGTQEAVIHHLRV